MFVVKVLCKKYRVASNGIDLTKGPFEDLSQSLEREKLRLWAKEAQLAEEERGEALDIYALKMNQGVFSWSMRKLGIECEMCSAPSLADMRLSLAGSGKVVSEKLSSVGWMLEGIYLEDTQCVSHHLLMGELIYHF